MWYLIVSIPDLCTLTYFEVTYPIANDKITEGWCVSVFLYNVVLLHKIDLVIWWTFHFGLD